jgi:hypothetical protein
LVQIVEAADDPIVVAQPNQCPSPSSRIGGA